MSVDEALALEAWKETQANLRSFNDILMKIRSLAVLYAGAVISAALAVSWSSEMAVGFFLLIVTIPWVLLYMMDRMYYHVLLRGTVAQAISIESVLHAKHNLPELTAEVRKANHSVAVVGNRLRTGGAKVALFYGVPASLAMYFSFSLFISAHLRAGGALVEFFNRNWEDVGLAMGLIMGCGAAAMFWAFERVTLKRDNPPPDADEGNLVEG